MADILIITDISDIRFTDFSDVLWSVFFSMVDYSMTQILDDMAHFTLHIVDFKHILLIFCWVPNFYPGPTSSDVSTMVAMDDRLVEVSLRNWALQLQTCTDDEDQSGGCGDYCNIL